ncbi:MAG TPA: c-type cytochrome [Chloroflexota bacterium]|nr:c-type cytochrome [Chloroflexota bacterium]
MPPDAAGPAANATPGIGDAENGKRLFATRGCVGCHSVAGDFAGGITGPELRRALRQPTIAGGQPNTPETLWHFLENPAKVKPGTAMPRLPLSAQELDDLVAYLETLRQ